MKITWDDVVAHAPELSTVDAAARVDLLALANSVFNPAVLDGEDGPRTKLARVYYAAHLATIGGQGGSSAAGPIIEEEVGDVRVKYALISASSSATQFEGSSYGDLLSKLLRNSRARWPLVL